MKSNGLLAFHTIFVMAFLAACSSLQLTKSTQFSITRDTPITVDCGQDEGAITGLIEAELLKLGFNVVPFDQAQRVVELRKQSIQVGESRAERAQVQAVTYSPAAVILRVQYTYFRGSLGDGIPSLTARLLDLEQSRVLAIINFQKNGDRFSTSYVIGQVGGKLKELLE